MLTVTDPLGNITTLTYETIRPGGVTFRALFYSELSTTTDALGNTTSYTYDRYGNPLSLIDALGNTTSITYVGDQPSAFTFPDGAVSSVEYDSAGNITSRVNPLGHEKQFTWDDNKNKLSETIFRTIEGSLTPITTHFEYDANNRLITTILPDETPGDLSDNPKQRIEYDAAGQVAARIDPAGRRTTFAYDNKGNIVRTVYPDLTFEQREYDAVGNMISQTDKADRKTIFEYDALNRRVRTILPDETPGDLSDNPTLVTVYDAVGHVIAEINPLGTRTDSEYDASGRLIRTLMPEIYDDNQGIMVRPAISNAYDAAGRLTGSIDPNGNVMHFAVDRIGRPTGVTRPDESTTIRTYDETGRLVESVDAEGNQTVFEYDRAGRLTSVTQPPPAEGEPAPVTTYGYDEAGNLVSQTDALGLTTQFEYDLLGRLIHRTLPLVQSESFVYDVAGNVIQHTDFNGDATTFEYDPMNRITRKSYANGTQVTFTYTPTGKKETVTDIRGVTRYRYDALDRLVSRTDPDGQLIEYTYDNAGNRTSVIVPSGASSYTYDALNRLATVTDPSGNTTNYFYDAAANLVQTLLPNDSFETREYDELNRLTLVEHKDIAGNVLASFGYTLDAAGNRTTVAEMNGRQVEYMYDNLYRLTSESIVDPVVGGRTTDYSYDAVGNRLTRNDSLQGLTSYQYDNNHRLQRASAAGDESIYTYDNNGNLLSRVINTTDRVYYNWGVENRLLSADTDGDGTADVQYQYDADGIRIAQIVGSQETRFLIDANRQFSQVLEEYTPGGDIQVSYSHGNDLISQNRGGVLSLYHTDGLGSTRLLTDTAGILTDKYTYDAFGQTVEHTGDTDNVYLFAGEHHDYATGLDYLRARHMNSSIGRFLSRDPFTGDMMTPTTLHPYIYAADNPVNFVDPSGQLFTLIGLLTSSLTQNNVRSSNVVSAGRTVCRITSAIETLENSFMFSYVLAQLSFNYNELASWLFGLQKQNVGIQHSIVVKYERPKMSGLSDVRKNQINAVEAKISTYPDYRAEISVKKGIVSVDFSFKYYPFKDAFNEASGKVGLSKSFGEIKNKCGVTLGEYKIGLSGEVGISGKVKITGAVGFEALGLVDFGIAFVEFTPASVTFLPGTGIDAAQLKWR
jgi:RHS repeat-associated protein